MCELLYTIESSFCMSGNWSKRLPGYKKQTFHLCVIINRSLSTTRILQYPRNIPAVSCGNGEEPCRRKHKKLIKLIFLPLLYCWKYSTWAPYEQVQQFRELFREIFSLKFACTRSQRLRGHCILALSNPPILIYYYGACNTPKYFILTDCPFRVREKPSTITVGVSVLSLSFLHSQQLHFQRTWEIREHLHENNKSSRNCFSLFVRGPSRMFFLYCY